MITTSPLFSLLLVFQLLSFALFASGVTSFTTLNNGVDTHSDLSSSSLLLSSTNPLLGFVNYRRRPNTWISFSKKIAYNNNGDSPPRRRRLNRSSINDKQQYESKFNRNVPKLPSIPSSSSSKTISSTFQRRDFFKSTLATTFSRILPAATLLTTATTTTQPIPVSAMTADANYPLWPALPVAPYSKKRTLLQTIIKDEIWIMDQLIGIYYVHVPIRMTIVTNGDYYYVNENYDDNGIIVNSKDIKDINSNNDNEIMKQLKNNKQKVNKKKGLLIYAPIAPTKECLNLLRTILIQQNAIIIDIILPSVAVEHKVNAGPFARQFPHANLYVVDKQYSFPIPLPKEFLGLPGNTKILPRSSRTITTTTTSTSTSTSTIDDRNKSNSNRNNSNNNSQLLGSNLQWEVLTIKPGPASSYQDVGLLHKSSQTLLVCDAIFAVNPQANPPSILTEEPEYVRALLFHARDSKNETVEDTLANRRKGWRRIVLLFNFFFAGAAVTDLGIKPIVEALKTPTYSNGWGGWKPVQWKTNSKGEEDVYDFSVYSSNGIPTILPIIQIIMSRDIPEMKRWLTILSQWKFKRVITAHLDCPIDNVGPKEFVKAFEFVYSGRNEVRFCDEDVAFLRFAEETFLNFAVYKTDLGPLRGINGPCGL